MCPLGNEETTGPEGSDEFELPLAVDRALRTREPAYAGAIRVTMPPLWDHSGAYTFTLIFTRAEIDAEATRDLYRCVAQYGLPNPRLLTPSAIVLSSLYHPRFFANIARGPFSSLARGARQMRETATATATARSWLQSLLFLAGVTLSAAIIQDRWSAGTLRSKMTRLWQAGGVARVAGLKALAALDLEGFVARLAAAAMPDRDKLVELKKKYAAALGVLVAATPYKLRTLAPIEAAHPLWPRFGFLPELRARLGDNLRAVIVYGSSVTSPDFADYDLLIVVADSCAALTALAGTRPTYDGRELNMSVHDEVDFQIYQLASGDNLADYGLCLYGETLVPHKPTEDLLHRNMSFGYVRLRQLMGMAAHTQLATLAEDRDDKANLHGYFVKIPSNVFKGFHGVLGEILAKDQVAAAMRQRLSYDVDNLTHWCRVGRAGDALATAAWCTQALLRDLNSTFGLYQEVSLSEAQLWAELERPANDGKA